MKHSFYSYIWLLPFFICFIGYSIPWYFVSHGNVVVPSVVGLSLHDATLKISQAELSVIIKREESRSDLPCNIIIEQSPSGDSVVRAGQPIRLVSVAPKQNVVVPDFQGKTTKHVTDWAGKFDVAIKLIWIDSNRPTGEIIAQYPQASTLLKDAQIKIYVSHGQSPLFIIPTLLNARPVDVARSFERHGLKFSCVQEDGTHMTPHETHIVCGQSPIAGSIIDVNKTIIIQLSIR